MEISTRTFSGKQLLGYDLLKPYSQVVGFSTTRHGGCGKGTYASFNCTHYCGDSPEFVKTNRDILVGLLPQKPKELVIPRQTHSTCVRVISSPSSLCELDEVDAVVTNLPGYCMCISTADCIPILLYDTNRQVVAAVHAGWRGTVGRIVEKTLDTMEACFGTKGKDVVACIGPGISLEAFEVGDEVYRAFEEAGFEMSRISRRYTKWHLDLWEANRLQLLAHGVDENRIEVASVCTYHQCDDFFSARRLGIRSGRILSGVMLLD